MPASVLRLYVNIDHVATLRQARGGIEPDPLEAMQMCEAAGADGITVHLREDRRHIQDADVEKLAMSITTFFNFEMACVDEMIDLALKIKPAQVSLVPEKREEVTTEGGLDVIREAARVERAIGRLKDGGIHVSLFIDPDPDAIVMTRKLGADAFEMHTGDYANHLDDPSTLAALVEGAKVGAAEGLQVYAGHGLNVSNVGRVAAIPQVTELNIGHSIVSRSIFVGLGEAVREMRGAMDAARPYAEI
ncbi:MAG TPA: pyridoxine 5'-phosphate synthase [Gemmatimonadaceae bacterium]|nr:pyridoxine 5'-phosphate synthase [Gemmatimonadaceae bacterium]